MRTSAATVCLSGSLVEKLYACAGAGLDGVNEIKEVLFQTAIYCGVPDANTAFRIAQAVLADEETPHQEDDR